MKTKSLFLIALLSAVLGASCTPIKYLPKSDENAGVSQYGSYIQVKTVSRNSIAGELIAVQQDGLVIRQHRKGKPFKTTRTFIVPYQTISDFTLRYAESKLNGKIIPASLLFALMHGGYLVFTLPINFVTTGIVADSAKSEFEYQKKDIGIQDLKMFARFPQGIPDHIRLEDIR